MDYTKTWHFARTDLAKTYIQTLKIGPQSLAIFAERRKGKTEFLTEDVTPLAIESGYRCCYVNFWADRSDPVACLVNGVEQSLKQELGGPLRGWKKELSVNLGILQTKLIQNSNNNVQTANAALQFLMEPKGAVLLLCDEVQHLATRPAFEDFSASLRTFIEINKDRLRVIFTGSSQDNLNRLFKNQRAAFYNSASITPFPDMGVEFIEFLSKRFHYLSGRTLDTDFIMEAFVKHYNSPAFIVELLQVMIKEGIYSIDSGLRHYYSINPLDEDNKQTWNSLSALDQEVIKLLIKEQLRPLYHTNTYKDLSKKLGTKVGQGAVQHAINRLRDRGILIKVGHGAWSFENSSFKAFVEDNF